jgi:hypothetical protein
MNSLRADAPDEAGWGLEELQILAGLGFGPDSALMNEPKLFIDGAFLSALQRELMDELGSDECERTLLHIGLIHGLRDAARLGRLENDTDGAMGVIQYPPLAMRFGPGPEGDRVPGHFEMVGGWPDHFEAEARLSKVGPSSGPSCSLSAGYTSGWLSGTLDRDVVVLESSCRAAGHEQCTFVARDEDAWIGESDDSQSRRRLSVASLRTVACPEDGSDPRSSSTSLLEALPSHLDSDDPAVHIWGPVMVMPFTGPDAAIQTIDMLARDEATRAVRVVVLDLCGTLLDQGFGAAALERVIEEVQGWGAEVILTGISPISEDAVAELQASLLLSRKDLPEAIAYAFQIADAQRHLL